MSMTKQNEFPGILLKPQGRVILKFSMTHKLLVNVIFIFLTLFLNALTKADILLIGLSWIYFVVMNVKVL